MTIDEDTLQTIIDHISEFYSGESEDGGWETMINNFVDKYGHMFTADNDPLNQEQSLEYTPVYKEFQSLFEEKVEKIINDSKVDQHEFVRAVQERAKEDVEVKMFLDILVSVSDYQAFIEMMADCISERED